jgi:hypothetical protein
MQDWAERLLRLLFYSPGGRNATHAYERKYVGMMMSRHAGFATIGLSDEVAIASDTYLILDRSFLR